MANLIGQALDIVARTDASDAMTMGRAFHAALEPFGLRASYARAYSYRGAASETVLARFSPAGWEEAYAREKLAHGNFIVRESRRRSAAFAWSDALGRCANDQKMWAVLQAHGFPDGLGIPCHGPNGYLGVVSLAFENLADLGPDQRRTIEIASLIVHDRLRSFVDIPVPGMASPLSARERDCLGYVAEGKSDWEIGVIMSISQSTARFHVENAKIKLDARTRAQACARAVGMGLI